MNKRFIVLIVTGTVFASFFAAGCAAHKRLPVSSVPVVLSTEAKQITNPVMTESQKVVTVYKEVPVQSTAEETETTTTEAAPAPTAKPTAKPTATPTKKPTAKPTKKPTAKPTKKPTAKPTKKPTAKPKTKPVKSNTLSAAPKNADAGKITGIYNGSWSQITVDATNLKSVKITATIHDPQDSNKTSVWKMSGKFNTANGTIVYKNCTKTNFQYDESGSIVSKSVAFDNGQGKVVICNGMLTWNDYQEHAADDMTFISAKSHDHRG